MTERGAQIHSAIAVGLLTTVVVTGCQVILGLEIRESKDPPEDAATVAEDARGEPNGIDADSSSCPFGQISCGAECVRLAADARHCGACGHDCLGAECLLGQCAPETLTTRAYVVLTSSNDEVFFRDEPDEVAFANLVARNKTTGAERVLTRIGIYAVGAVEGDEIFVAEAAPAPRIIAVNLKTNERRTVFAEPEAAFIRWLEVDSEAVHFTTRLDVRRVQRDGTIPTVLTTISAGQFGAGDLVLSPTRMLFSVPGTYGLWSAPRDGGVESLAAASAAPATEVERDSNTTYWLSGSKLHVLDELPAPLDKSYDLGLRVGHSMTLKPPYLYIYDVEFGKETSRILRFDTRTSEVLTLATNLRDGVLTVDDKYVYFGYYKKGLYRIAR